jgi:hypothetical protein
MRVFNLYIALTHLHLKVYLHLHPLTPTLVNFLFSCFNQVRSSTDRHFSLHLFVWSQWSPSRFYFLFVLNYQCYVFFSMIILSLKKCSSNSVSSTTRMTKYSVNAYKKMFNYFAVYLLKILFISFATFLSSFIQPMRGASRIYFFYRIYCFIKDLLWIINCINISAHPHSKHVHMYRRIVRDLLQNA